MGSTQKEFYKTKSRVRAFNYINNRYLLGKTKVPAWHIERLDEIEVSLVIADVLRSSMTMQGVNVSDWVEMYRSRAIEALKRLEYDSSSEDATADSQNTGDGTVTITTNDNYTRTERWIIEAVSETQFYAYGEITGKLPEITVGIQYPAKEKYENPLDDEALELTWEKFPISILIAAGSTAFAKHDRFTFTTYAASYYGKRNIVNDLKRG